MHQGYKNYIPETTGDVSSSNKRYKWYQRPMFVIMSILFFGPFALPVLWLSPAFKLRYKISISILIGLLCLWFVKAVFVFQKAFMDELRVLEHLKSR